MHQLVDLLVGQSSHGDGVSFCSRAPLFEFGHGVAPPPPGIQEFRHFLRRNEEGGRTAMPCDHDGLALRGVKQLPEPILRFTGCKGYHSILLVLDASEYSYLS